MPGIQDLPRLARLPLAVATRTAGFGLSVARDLGARLIGGNARERRRGDADRDTPARATAPAPARPRPAPPARPAPPVPPAPTPSRPAAEPSVPAHVDREAVLVAESADPEATDGVGASVHVAEPWANYSKLTADQVIDRLAAADAESIAAIRLYEASHRNRATVIAEADRRMAIAGR